MKNKKRYGMIVAMMVGFILVVISMIRIVTLNAEWQQVQKRYIPAGENQEVISGILLSVQETERLNKAELEQRYGDELYIMDEYDYIGIKVRVKLKNISEQEQLFPVYQLYLESDQNYYSGLDMEMYLMDNEETSEIVLRPQEEKEVWVTYSISDVGFREDEWQDIKKDRTYLVNERYPVKDCWMIE